MSDENNREDGFIVPDPSKVREDIPGDAGDEANVIRFSEEQALIEEQDIVYREPSPPKLGGTEPMPQGDWHLHVQPTPTLLFRVPLARGVSITAGCLGWEQTAEVLRELAAAARKRRG